MVQPQYRIIHQHITIPANYIIVEMFFEYGE